ncbi:LOW QUALITY PROTEIN: cubilin [Lepeophtheirus salmonis]|uniref:LOW QUALITY PROTEIN: cubilin n=1 Tax=Lepeophtheirus salmonis TaxID=72036 RepID=UPI003AF40624
MVPVHSGLLCILGLLIRISQGCDIKVVSTSSPGSKNGTFRAPNFLNPEEHVTQCTYTFQAAENERVEIEFDEFDLDGTPPDGAQPGSLASCYHEHLDLFTEALHLNVSLIETPFGGRYCGKIPPRTRISLYRYLSFVFLSDRDNVTDARFSGYYRFIPDDKYNIGTPIPNVISQKGETCSFLIYAKHKKRGEIMTPTYPGTYPKNTHCTFKFIGEPNQRLRLEFRDFDLFYGGAHCPFDYVTIYDGPDKEAEKIGTYCGQMRNLVIYSTKNMMYVTFTTLRRTAPVQNRGFYGLFEFSENFVKLNFIQSDATHIRGTECDQTILSKKESSGTVFSPNYPFPYQTNVVCRYFIYGMQDEQNLERVILKFEKFNIPMSGKSCNDGYLKVYIRGQEEDHRYNEHDFEFCGKQDPEAVRTPGPRLVLLFNAGSKPGSGFKALFKFETEYLIPIGTPSPEGHCEFTYKSLSRKEGRFNSPRHPSNYPSSTNCTYLFYAEPNEQVQIVFDTFKVRTDNLQSNTSLGAWKAYGRNQCVEDWLEIFQVYRDKTEELVGRYCASSSPGPVVSLREVAVGLKVFLLTDDKDVFSGFMGRYLFFKEKSIFGDGCGGNITDLDNGVITSPNYPEKYSSSKISGNQQCHWFIHVKPRHKILLYFEEFEVEGTPNDRGCPAATLRVWPWNQRNKTPLELCGDSLEHNTQILSETNMLRISFFIADKAVGAKGFKAIWTEIKDGPSCDEFHCFSSSFCISSKLKCNGVKNCGHNDESDEIDCVIETEVNEYMVIGLGIGAVSVVMIAVLLYCHRKRKRRRLDHPMLPSHAHFHTCESIGERFATSSSMDSGFISDLKMERKFHIFNENGNPGTLV